MLCYQPVALMFQNVEENRPYFLLIINHYGGLTYISSNSISEYGKQKSMCHEIGQRIESSANYLYL